MTVQLFDERARVLVPVPDDALREWLRLAEPAPVSALTHVEPVRRPFNAELAFRALDRIERHPGEWAQHAWICPHGMCYAGHVAALAGAQVPTWDQAQARGWLVDTRTGAWRPHPTPRTLNVGAFAAERLSVTVEQADALFFPLNQLEDLRGMVRTLTDNPDADITPVRKREALRHWLGIRQWAATAD